MADERPNVLLFPFMAEGHIIPFLALAHHIEQKGYTVTFVNTPRNIKKLHQSLRPPPSSSIKLVEIPFNCADHGLPPEAENTNSGPYELFIRLIEATPALELPFRKLLSDLIETGEKPLCVVSDFFFGWAAEVAHEFGIFHSIFSGSSAFGMACCYSLRLNLPHRHTDNVEFSLPDFPEAGKVHVTQLPFPMLVAGENDPMTKFQRKNLPKWSSSDAFIFNTVEDLDRSGLSFFRRKLRIPVWPIGPLLLSRRDTGREETSSLEKCIEWLDKREPKSVLYISFGSQNTISASQMMNLAKTLDASSRGFIWVVRPPLETDINAEFAAEKWLPAGFTQRVHDEERGLIISTWAPQVEILAHESVAAFMSHCGWNSLLESLKNGVPLIGWPVAAEQFYNAKLLVEEVGVCVEVARGTKVEVREEDITEKIELVMGESEKGKRIRRRTAEVKEMIEAAMRDEGDYKASSVKAMQEFFAAAAKSCCC
ncbi:UDP-glycosyltransferase 92A1 [Sesamum alatum]|uniref:Glycosyltransferase n=1 Tax=Sesamum alatum TaxID=300844 RepID=A0AAE1XWV3_9LAMI|nr:UDP-glycosyltransferase 92A1 [Sesamum alatum]